VRSGAAQGVLSLAETKENILPEHSNERDQAEAKFKKAQKAVHDAKEARAQYENDARAVREKTAKLRALRLAKEAADAQAEADNDPLAAKPRPESAKR
jgi:hypothetical protein